YEIPAPTGDKFTEDGWLRTSDVASADFESALMEHPALAEAAVIAIPDAKWGERPLACVVLKSGKEADAKEFNEHLLARSFAKWQLPDRYEFVEGIPHTSTGKSFADHMGQSGDERGPLLPSAVGCRCFAVAR
ncbi:hypothetical protein XI07_04815, partial [Bradyrhizobium sp. CCBAU 11445]|uniref:AMP-binding enzyme n=1 Tax=Bradyrhizobium sp. CCBAU 11445 TaxID=1630896 RepID=UPI003FA4CA16|nr:hypothetical protein [Bradyrhizobium sp. CCBAU 11445]